ncbi:MAG: hypothetical protein KAS87_02095 [Candidatus Omnitrophica bacterium]|nr:hypothetical protein [Candidatus Omnitrophota bacterium]
MAIFNVAFLNPKMRKSGGGGVKMMSNKIAMLESFLLGEGNELSVGDLDILIDERKKLQNSGVLTATQISDQDVKIARYEQQKESILVQRTENIDRMDEDIEKDDIDMFKIFENNPVELTRAKVASLTLKVDKLTEAIQKRELLGQDTTELELEKESVKTEWNARTETMQAAKSFKGGDSFVNGQVAYVVTNNKGEAIRIDYAPAGTKSGYAETAAIMNGFRVYGKINENIGGKNIFKIAYGGHLMEFTAPDVMMPDAAHPGEYKPTKLIADVEKMGPYTVGKHGYVDLSSGYYGEEKEENYKEVQIQRAIPRDTWAKGLDGIMYHRKKDGNFEKHLNINYSPMGLDPGVMYTISPQEEAMIWRKTDETIDHADVMEPEEEMPMEEMQTIKDIFQPKEFEPTTPSEMSMMPQVETQPARLISTTRRTPQQPKEQVSPGIMETAKRTMRGGMEYLKSRFR